MDGLKGPDGKPGNPGKHGNPGKPGEKVKRSLDKINGTILRRHIKKVFLFNGRTTKGVERVNPGYFSPKIGKKKKNCQNPFQAIIRLKGGCREGKTLVIRPLKKLLCVSSLKSCGKIINSCSWDTRKENLAQRLHS